MDDRIDKIEELKTLVRSFATTGSRPGDEKRYQELRSELLRSQELSKRLPPFIRHCDNREKVFRHMQAQDRTYSGRNDIIEGCFAPILRWLELGNVSPAESQLDGIGNLDDIPNVVDRWQTAFDRCRDGDFDGAITASRTLVEEVCKYVLDTFSTDYPRDADLPRLLSLSFDKLTLESDGAMNGAMRRIRGGLCGVVQGVGEVRKVHGDAHGKGHIIDSDISTMAQLSVNLASSVALFLLKTFEDRNETE